MLFAVYEIDYPEEGFITFDAESEDEAKKLYIAYTGGKMELDKLGIWDVCEKCGQVIFPDDES
jgi:hypothetical protein